MPHEQLGVQGLPQHVRMLLFCPNVANGHVISQHGVPNGDMFRVHVRRPLDAHWVDGRFTGPLVVLENLEGDVVLVERDGL